MIVAAAIRHLPRASGVGLTRRLPREHAPLLAGLRVDGQIADGEALLLAVVLDVHLGDAVDDADVAVNPRVSVARRDAAIVRLAGAEIGQVLLLGLQPRAG